MASDEWRALGWLLTRAVVEAVTRTEEIHAAIARRSFQAVGPVGRPVRKVHDTIMSIAYAGTRGIAATAGLAASEALTAAANCEAMAETWQGPHAAVALGVLNGAIGDRLHLERNPLALSATVRGAGHHIAPRRAALTDAFPTPTGRLAVFVHGLGETDDAWRVGARRHYGDTVTTHGSQLARDLGFTPVYVRYNSGRSLDDSVAELDDLLEWLTGDWPVAVDEVALIGHSMGALIARVAHARASERGAAWPAQVRHLVFLGAPHLGAPLERGVELVSRALSALPETRPFATMLGLRSAGIRDLGQGHAARGCWLRGDAMHPVTEHFIVGTVAPNPHGRVGLLIGDLVVTPRSAAGSHCSQCEVRLVDSVDMLGGLHHADLLNHPAVYVVLRERLARERRTQHADEDFRVDAAGIGVATPLPVQRLGRG